MYDFMHWQAANYTSAEVSFLVDKFPMCTLDIQALVMAW